MDGNIKEIEMAATGKSAAGSSVTAAAGTALPAEGAKPKEAAKPVPAARRPEPDLEALEQGKPAGVDCLEIARKSKWRGRCVSSITADLFWLCAPVLPRLVPRAAVPLIEARKLFSKQRSDLRVHEVRLSGMASSWDMMTHHLAGHAV